MEKNKITIREALMICKDCPYCCQACNQTFCSAIKNRLATLTPYKTNYQKSRLGLKVCPQKLWSLEN